MGNYTLPITHYLLTITHYFKLFVSFLTTVTGGYCFCFTVCVDLFDFIFFSVLNRHNYIFIIRKSLSNNALNILIIVFSTSKHCPIFRFKGSYRRLQTLLGQSNTIECFLF
jgi:hypothetical protein